MVALPSPTENKLLLKELKFSLLFFLIVKIPIGRGEGAAIDTPRGRDGLLCRIRWWLQSWSVKVGAVRWLQERPKVLGL